MAQRWIDAYMNLGCYESWFIADEKVGVKFPAVHR